MSRRFCRFSGVLAFCLVAALCLSQGFARPRQGAQQGSMGVVPTIEKSLSRLAKTRPLGDPELMVAESRRGSIWIRPARKVIEVRRWLSSRGYVMGEGGVLSSGDRLKLNQQIAQICPKATSASVRRTLLQELKGYNRYKRTLRQQDSKIDSILGRAAQARNGTLPVLWQSSKASLSFRPEANVLVGSRGLGQRGFRVERQGNRLTLAPYERQALREFLHQGSR